ncbi:SMP-30/gluconolactonase/LRE family protein [Maritalea mediterranea]|uniref:SMP-30/gluconolactonase/LRE family protein n=1 Tax=Maritalea mediterranea TaxID=2909667 RepID=A0ABS9E2I2_9HYPH|nr:SMP-30/gluconolactonase/LRE family protein [Maritalea mediterranea]MCF4097071.1 SMP-30/gluconolactonase/LRE family protein [Maritalea mediterranea]
MAVEIFDQRQNTLGEGPLWHPLRQQLFWFDIPNRLLRSQKDGQALEWAFDEIVTAAGWLDETKLVIASERQIFIFDLETNTQTHLVDLEKDVPSRRSNDGRVDPWGGFWIGTMSKTDPSAEKGGIYRFYQGELRLLVPEVAIPNAICFAHDRSCAYYTDTPTQLVWKQMLDAEGWPLGEPIVHVDLRKKNLNPDGALIDQHGHMWIACWGAACVARFDERGQLVDRLELPATQPTCPAFGGSNFTELYLTSARENLASPHQADGQTLRLNGVVSGQAEYAVSLD